MRSLFEKVILGVDLQKEECNELCDFGFGNVHGKRQ